MPVNGILNFPAAINEGLNVIERFNSWNDSKIRSKVRLRLLYAECFRNHALLCAVDLTGPSKKSDISAWKVIIDKLETQIIELIFLEGKENLKLFEYIKNMQFYKETGEKAEPVHAKDFSILLNKILVLKKIAEIGDNERLKNVRYKVRLTNIKNALGAILSGMMDAGGILFES